MPAIKSVPTPAPIKPEPIKAPEVDHTAIAVARMAQANAQVAAEVAANTQAQSRLAASMKDAMLAALQNHPAPAKELEVKFLRDPVTDRLAGMKVTILR